MRISEKEKEKVTTNTGQKREFYIQCMTMSVTLLAREGGLYMTTVTKGNEIQNSVDPLVVQI
jgi:hypothetical protein